MASTRSWVNDRSCSAATWLSTAITVNDVWTKASTTSVGAASLLSVGSPREPSLQ